MTFEFIVSYHDPKNYFFTGERITRCKECRYLHKTDYYWCELASTAKVKYQVSPHDYCSRGETMGGN